MIDFRVWYNLTRKSTRNYVLNLFMFPNWSVARLVSCRIGRLRDWSVAELTAPQLILYGKVKERERIYSIILAFFTIIMIQRKKM